MPPSRNARRAILFLASAGLLVILYALRAWWLSPEHRIHQFVTAGHRGHLAGMLSLADPEEVKRLGLTDDKFAAMLAEAAMAPVGVSLGERLRWEDVGEPQNLYNRWAWVSLRDRRGAPLLDTRGGPAELSVIAYNCDAGWRISPSKFLYTVLATRQGMELRKERYAALCLRDGVPPEFYWPEKGEWERVSPAP